jgi:glycosyltransferase involved in cell wall biosynthesis
VLFFGGEFDRKGGTGLLEAARGLGDRIHFDLVTGSQDLQIPAGVAATVYRGLKPQSENLVQLFRTADIFALPSRGDCMPQAIAEALACGLPVVATSVGAIPEMVTDAVNGYLVRPRSPRALRAAIASLANSPGQRHAMGRWGRKVALQDHDAARNNGRILAIMKRLAASRSGVPAPEDEP